MLSEIPNKSLYITRTKRFLTKDKIHYNKYKPTDTLFFMTIKCIVLGILGLFIGVIINDSVVYLSNTFNIKNLFLQNIIQISICSFVLSFLHTKHNMLGWTLQETLPGVTFIAFLFGVQFKILHNIEQHYITEDALIENKIKEISNKVSNDIKKV